MRKTKCLSIVLISALGYVSVIPRTALGHAMLVSRGTATIHSEHVTLAIEINAEDFLHAPQMRPDAQGKYPTETLRDLISGKAEQLSETIILRDGRGRRLPAYPYTLQTPLDLSIERLTPQNMRRMRIHYHADYRLSDPIHHLSFQAALQQGTLIVAWQLTCVVRAAGQPDARTIRLTSRGNIETVKIIRTPQGVAVATGGADAAMGCADRIGEGLCADIRIQEDGLHARIEVPLPLLSTWMSLPTTDDEYLTVFEQQQTVNALGDPWKNALVVRMDAVEVAAQSLKFTWIPLDAESDGSMELGGDVSIWNGRLRVELHFPTNGFPASLELRWNLFNHSALTAHAYLRSGQTVTEHEFSTYAADYHWLPDVVFQSK